MALLAGSSSSVNSWADRDPTIRNGKNPVLQTYLVLRASGFNLVELGPTFHPEDLCLWRTELSSILDGAKNGDLSQVPEEIRKRFPDCQALLENPDLKILIHGNFPTAPDTLGYVTNPAHGTDEKNQMILENILSAVQLANSYGYTGVVSFHVAYSADKAASSSMKNPAREFFLWSADTFGNYNFKVAVENMFLTDPYGSIFPAEAEDFCEFAEKAGISLLLDIEHARHYVRGNQVAYEKYISTMLNSGKVIEMHIIGMPHNYCKPNLHLPILPGDYTCQFLYAFREQIMQIPFITLEVSPPNMCKGKLARFPEYMEYFQSIGIPNDFFLSGNPVKIGPADPQTTAYMTSQRRTLSAILF